jgi:hypothetical protein
VNESLVLDWLLYDAERNADRYYDELQEISLQGSGLREVLYELNNRREIALPSSLPKIPGKMIPVLREHFNDNVTFISLVLNHHFPEKYLFYRVSDLEEEIFEGFEFFSEIVPEFRLGFPRVGGTGFGRYLKLNEVLLQFAHARWPRLKAPQKRLAYFLYQGLGRLFLERSGYNRYWVMATHEEHFGGHDARNKDVVWSGRKVIQPDDLAFVYRTAPRKAITDILRVKEEPSFDPWGAWDGFWVKMQKVCTIEGIPFAEMKKDPVLQLWSAVRKNFQGTVTEPVPYMIYNRLLDRIPEATRRACGLEPEPSPQFFQQPTVSTSARSGKFTSEAEFEEEVIAPLLKQWGFKYERQHPCLFRVGSQYRPCKVDFYVSDERGPLTLFENKSRIPSDKDLKPAVDQAKSYALLLGLPSFVVASPEGMWVYTLERNREELISQFPVDTVNCEEEIKNLLLKRRQ